MIRAILRTLLDLLTYFCGECVVPLFTMPGEALGWLLARGLERMVFE